MKVKNIYEIARTSMEINTVYIEAESKEKAMEALESMEDDGATVFSDKWELCDGGTTWVDRGFKASENHLGLSEGAYVFPDIESNESWKLSELREGKHILKPTEKKEFNLGDIVWRRETDSLHHVSAIVTSLNYDTVYITEAGGFEASEILGFDSKSTLEAFIEMSANTNISEKAKAAIDNFLN